MGEKQNQPFQFSFNACLKVDFQGSQVTSDAEEHLHRGLFGQMLRRIYALPVPNG